VEITNNESERQYEIRVDDQLVGWAPYRLTPDAIVFTHTEVLPAYGGKGVGSALAAGALDDVRRKGQRVVARCPFIAKFIERHAEYADLLAPTPSSVSE
jgi:predicted GNAT family acetyltransferase